MVSFAISFALLINTVLCIGLTRANIVRRTDNTQPAGTNPISQFQTQYLGFQVANNSCSHRDLGFTGELGGKWYALFGDTLWCDRGVTDPALDTQGFHGMVRDAISELTSNPLRVNDLNLNNDSPVRHQLQFVPFNASWGETNTYGFGGTSIVQVNKTTTTGAVYYLVNANDKGLVGAGIGEIHVINGTPTVTKRYGDRGFWWNSTQYARYGDIATYLDVKSDYVYIWGGPPNYITDFVGSAYVYLARVKAADAFDLSKYQYWWGTTGGWKSDILTTFNATTAVWWASGQGQVVWSNTFNTYILVHLGPGSNDVLLRTATNLEGPWTPDVKVFTATPIDGGLTYTGCAHPYLDESGKTLTISYTNNNHIEVIKVSFTV